jgi:hypothetical protein
LHHSHDRNRGAVSENRKGNSGEPQRIWAEPANLPGDTLEYVTSAIVNALAGHWFSEHGW